MNSIHVLILAALAVTVAAVLWRLRSGRKATDRRGPDTGRDASGFGHGTAFGRLSTIR